MFKKRSMTYRNYLLIAVALLLVAAIVFLNSFHGAVEALERTQYDNAGESMRAFLSSLDAQHEMLREASYAVQANYNYSPIYLNRQKINIYNSLSKFKSEVYRLGIVEKYFLLYCSDLDFVLMSQGTSCTPVVYLRDVLHLENADDLVGILYDVNNFMLIKASPVWYLACFPLNFNPGLDSRAVMVYCIPGDYYKTLYDRYMDNYSTEFRLTYENMDVLTSDNFDTDENDLDAVSEYGYNLSVHLNPNRAEALLRYRKTLNTVYFALIGLLVLLLAFLSARIMNRPILKLLHKFDSDRVGNENELQRLEKIMEDALEQKNFSIGLLRNQITEKLLLGTLSSTDREICRLLSININSPAQVVMIIDGERNEDFAGNINDLQGEGTDIYSRYMDEPQPHYAIAIGCENEETLMETVSYVEILASDRLVRFASGCGFDVLYREILNGSNVQTESIEEKTEYNSAMAAKIVKYIHENIMDPDLSLTQICDEFDLTERYISRLVKEETGEPYKVYVTRCRIELACELLRNGDILVGDVANRVGYRSAGNFIKRFKEITGMTPKLYLENINR